MLNFVTTYIFKEALTFSAYYSQISSGFLKFGLFKNDVDPSPTLILADIEPATFGGYTGLQPFLPVDPEVYANAAFDAQWDGNPYTWAGDTSLSGIVYGIYAVFYYEGEVQLAASALLPGGPKTMLLATDTIQITPHGIMGQY